MNVSPKVSSYGQDEKHTCLLMKDVLGFLLSDVCKRMALLTPCLLGLGSDKQRAKPRFMKCHRAKPRSGGSHKGCPGAPRTPGHKRNIQGGRTLPLPLPLQRSVKRRGTAQAMGPKPSHPEDSCISPAKASPTKMERRGLCRSRGQRYPPPISLGSPQPWVLAQAWGVGGAAKCPIQSDKWVGCLFRFQNTWKW